MISRRLFCASLLAFWLAAPSGAQQPPPAAGQGQPTDPLPRYTELVQRFNRRLPEADARRVAGLILSDSGNAQIDPALLVAVMATDGTLQAAGAVNGMLFIRSVPAERFIDTTAQSLHRLISQSATNGQVTPAAISSALGARASAAIAGRRGTDQGVKNYVVRVERLYRELLADQAKAQQAPAK